MLKKTGRIAITLLAAFALPRNVNAQIMETSLTPKQQKIATIAANTAVGDLDALQTELNGGLDAGLTVNQIREVLVQLYAYAGFPRSLQGLNTFMGVLEQRRSQGIRDEAGPDASPVTDTRDKYTRGKETLEQLTGRHEAELTGANAFAPAIDRFLKEHLFADIFERDVLTFRERELATVSALAVLPGVEPMFRSHVGIGLNTGWTQTQLDEAVALVRSTVKPPGRTPLFPRGNRLSNDFFTGTAHLQGLVSPDQMENLYTVGSVTFEPGARTHWHTHPAGQTLIVTEGEGFYQERGQPAQKLTPGSVVAIPRDIEHWHGASNGSRLVHIAISNQRDGSSVTWLAPVSESEYAAVHLTRE